jgi:prolyl-tRNA synthetase
VRGDHEVNEIKVQNAVGANLPAEADEASLAPPHVAGLYGADRRQRRDRRRRRNGDAAHNTVVGANLPTSTYVNVNPGRDFKRLSSPISAS